MSVIKTAIKQPVLVNLLMALVLVAGVVYGSASTKELYPDVNPPGVLVQSIYPGIAAEEMEKLVSRPLEDAVQSAEDVVDIHSVSYEGLSVMFIEFAPEADIDKAVSDVQNRIDEVRSDLPPDMDAPTVRQAGRQMPVIQVALQGVTGGDPHMMRKTAKLLQEKLEAINNVHSVDQSGIREREIRVIAEPRKLEAYDTSLTELAVKLKSRNRNMPGGSISAGTREFTVRAMSEYGSLEDLRNVVVKRRADGKHVLVRHVAQVKDTFQDRATGGWVGGLPAVLLNVVKRDKTDAHKTVAAVKKVLDAFKRSLPEGYSIKTFGDTTKQVDRNMSVLYQNGVMGIALVLAVLWLFLGFRNAAFAALGIPFALAGGVVVMYLLGVTINQLSIFGLVLCIGIIVDDAIVVVENCYRHLERGAKPKVAALLGTKEVMWPVIATVLTTVAAFLPLLLMTGVFGQFLSVIPKVVVAALVASLIEALIVLPSHLAEFPSKVKESAGPGLFQRFAWRIYTPSFRAVLKLRYVAVPVALLVAALAIGVTVKYKEIVLFASTDTEQFDARVELPLGTSLQTTERVLRQVEQVMSTIPKSERVTVLTQSGWSRTSMFPTNGKHLGMVTVVLKPASQRERTLQQIMASVRPRLARIAGPVRPVELVETGFSPPTGDPVAVRVQGDDMDRLLQVAQEVEKELAAIPGVKDVGRDYHRGSPEYRLRVNEQRAALHGLGTSDVAEVVNIAYMGLKASKYRDGDEEVDVVLRYPESVRSDVRQLGRLALPLVASAGSTAKSPGRPTPIRRLSIGDVATVETAAASSSIRRRNRRRTITVTARLEPGYTSQGANQAAQKRMSSLMAANPDVSFSFGGEFEKLNESLQSLVRAFLIAILVIYLVLAAQFRSFVQPVVVLLAVPLSFIGAAVGFFVSGQAIDFVALLGVVGLAGIVVNDSLILVEFINARRRRGMARDQAIAEAGRLRMRPILLTSITTVAGLMPMSLGWFGDSGGLAPMATAIAWGLLFATALTLYIVPAAYAIVDDLVRLVYRLFGREPKVSDDLEEEAELDALDRLPLREAVESTR